jgi:hypothetical protein
MTETVRTLIFAGAAALLIGLAMITTPASVAPEFFNDEGDLFFPEFTDPTAATSLEIVEFDRETASNDRFVVHFEGGRFTIPSHSNYPADAKDRMAGAAGMFIGLVKEEVRSDAPGDHKTLGVIDPEDPGVDIEGRGTRVTFRDSSGEVLASLIIGKEVEGRTDSHFVRRPDTRRTYSAKIPAEINTKFEDWIETDLLKITTSDIARVVFDNYSVEERGFQAFLKPGEKVQVVRDGSTWTLADLAEGEELDTGRMSDVTSELDSLKIVGVRRKPEGIGADLTVAEQDLRRIAADLAHRGFYLAQDRSIVSNEGDLIAGTKKGVRYTLRFGEVLFGRGEAVTAGTGDAESGGEGGETEDKDGLKANRYLMVTVEFDESLLDPPEAPALPEDELTKRSDARNRITEISAAIRQYVKREGKLPESLMALTEGPEPLLTEAKKDPWDSDYVFRPGDGEGETQTFTVVSYGADQAEGGEGAGTDLVSDNLAVEDDFRKAVDDWKAHEQTVEEGKELATKLSARFAPWYYVIDADSFDTLKVSRADLLKKADEDADDEEDGDEGEHDDHDDHDHDEDEDEDEDKPENGGEKKAPDDE